MKIAIDTSPIIYGTGVSVYTKNLLANLLKIDKVNEYILFGGSLRRYTELNRAINQFRSLVYETKLVTRVFPLPPVLSDVIWNKIHILRIEKLVGKIDVFHSSDWTQPSSKAFKVTTIHDLVPLKFPEVSHPKLVSAHKSRLKWVIEEVDRIIVPSRTTAKDVEELGIRRERIRVIPEAVNPQIKPVKKSDVRKLKTKYRISDKYLLAVGVNPRKNTEGIILAYEKVKARTNLKLVVIGYPYVKVRDIRGVIYTGHVPDSEMAIFYSGAEALVYPSFYEGFGLPILEAFVCETPVVTSNVGSMAEVAGKSAILVNPNDVDSIAEGILKAIKNKEKLVRLGSERVKQFSWEKTARKTLEVYREANSHNGI